MHVRILKPAKSAMQSGMRNTKKWIMQFPQRDRADPNSLTGWPSSRDTLKQVALEFDSEAEAIEYAKKNSYTYDVDEPHGRISKPKSYSDNFKFNKIS
jgi:hypothetical protein